MRFTAFAAIAATGAAVLAFAAAAPASAHTAEHSSGAQRHQWVTVATAHLGSINHSGARGTSVVVLRGNQADTWIYATGLLRNAPHAQHFHVDGMGRCPTPAADTNHDGTISTTEGHEAYGMIGTSLTTTGDTSPASGLAVDRFPTTPRGVEVYHRTVTVTNDVAANIRAGKAVLVIHGIDTNHDGTYDGSAPSDLDPSLPLEATSPAACGAYHVRSGWDLDLGLNLGLTLGIRL